MSVAKSTDPMLLAPCGLQGKVSRATFLFCAATAIVALATSAFILHRSERAKWKLDLHVQHTRLAHAIEMDALQCRRWEQEYFLQLDDRVQRQAPLQQWFVSDQALERSLAALAETPLTDDEQQLLVACRTATSHYRRAFAAIVGEIERGVLKTPQSASDALLALIDDKQDATSLAHDIAHYNFAELTNNEVKLANSLRGTAFAIGMALGAMIATVWAWKFWFYRAIIARVARLTQAVVDFSDGDFSRRIEDQGRDELGLIASQFNSMARNLDTQHRELLAAKEAADASNESKTEFLANISHELRTPLHGIISFTRFGIDESQAEGRAQLAGYFDTIGKCGDSLLNLVNDLLDLAKLEAGRMKLDFEKHSLAAVIAVVVDEFHSLCSERDLKIIFNPPDEDPEILLDFERIKQVVRNLLSNAVKFSPRGGEIHVEMTCSAGDAQVSVIDQGPGIPPDELELIFDKFVQSSKTKSGSGGTGLGLAICRQIITGHRGRIWAKNSRQQGAVLRFELPLCEVEESAHPVELCAAGSLEQVC